MHAKDRNIGVQESWIWVPLFTEPTVTLMCI